MTKKIVISPQKYRQFDISEPSNFYLITEANLINAFIIEEGNYFKKNEIIFTLCTRNTQQLKKTVQRDSSAALYLNKPSATICPLGRLVLFWLEKRWCPQKKHFKICLLTKVFPFNLKNLMYQ